MMWRWLVLAILIFVCFMWPFYSFVTYCALSYVLMGYMFLSGELSTVGSVPAQIFKCFMAWLFAPLYMVLIVLFFALRSPIL